MQTKRKRKNNSLTHLSERQLRIRQIASALTDALKSTYDEDWFNVLSKIQEAEIVVRHMQPLNDGSWKE